MMKKISYRNEPYLNSLYLPWGTTDVITANCPEHPEARLARIGDQIFQCPVDERIFNHKGSAANQTNRDNYYLGEVLKGF
jgi:hypothetical protein